MPTTTRTVGTSPKVVASSLTGLGAGVVLAVLNGLVANSALLGGLPPVLQALILLIVPPVAQYLIPYAAAAGRVETDVDYGQPGDPGWS